MSPLCVRAASISERTSAHRCLMEGRSTLSHHGRSVRDVHLYQVLDLVCAKLWEFLRASSSLVLSLDEVSDQGSHGRHNAVGPSCFLWGSIRKGSATGPSAEAIDGLSLTSKHTTGTGTKAGESPCPKNVTTAPEHKEMWNRRARATHKRTPAPKEAYPVNQSVLAVR